MTNATAVNNRGRGSVLVGVDGSVSAQGALAWAAAEASSRHCLLRIVHAFSRQMISNALDMAFVGDTDLDLQSAAEWILAEAAAHAREVAPDIKVATDLFAGPPVPTLLQHAVCPVAVIRPFRAPSATSSLAGRLRFAGTSPAELSDPKEQS
ncbi:universal stress protein [Kribbella sp. NPDC050241]|uniref:universal stress protein n=1 Tax=Kribbella sp. NPDC050241 TaxID=3364115 RepID=UPI00378E3F5C